MATLTSSEKIEKFLFPDGIENMPSQEVLINKLRNGTLTVRDALIIHLRKKGVRIGAGELKEIPIAKQVEDIFGASSSTISGSAKRVVKFEDVLDEPYFKLTEDVSDDGQKALNKRLGKQIGLDIQAIDTDVFELARNNQVSVSRQELKKVKQPRGGLAFKNVPTPDIVWSRLMKAAAAIAVDPKYGPEVAKNFILAAIVPIRNSDLGQITVNKKFAEGLETVRPYMGRTPDGKLKLILPSMLGRGHKFIPDLTLTPFLQNLVEEEYLQAIENDKNYLFNHKKVTTTKMSGAVEKYFAPLFKEYEDTVLGRRIIGMADVRKIAASTIAKHHKINSPAIASQLLGHTDSATFFEGLSRIDKDSYISDIYDPKAQSKMTKTLLLYESLITDSIGAVDVNDIALQGGVRIYNNTISIDPITEAAEEQKITKLSKGDLKKRRELAAERHKTSVALEKEYQATSELKAEESLEKAAETRERRTSLAGTASKTLKAAAIDFESDTFKDLLEKADITDTKIFENKSNKEIFEIINDKLSGKSIGTAHAPANMDEYVEEVIAQLNPEEVPVDELRGKSYEEVQKTLGKWGKLGRIAKLVFPPLAVGLTGYALWDIKETPAEEFDIPEEQKTWVSKGVETGAKLFDADVPKTLKKARIIEETISPIPVAAIPRKDEEVIPFGKAISKQIGKLFPEDFNIGGPRGIF
tara:strand:+ start:113 stop:2203 length:2091 start_codon:yes stop_codon:yes gene_type:complete